MRELASRNGPSRSLQKNLRTANAKPNGDVRIRSLEVLRTGAKVLIRDMWFEGGDVLRCYAGRFRFTLEGRDPIMLDPGEVLIVYPEQHVTIEALGKRNLLRYAIFEGTGVSEYFNGFGFYDGLHGQTSAQLEVFESVCKQNDANAYGTKTSDGYLPQRMNDALVTFAHDLRETGNALVFDAVGQIRRNLDSSMVRIKNLCSELGVSRSHLHRAFVAHGLGSVAAFVKDEQFRCAVRLLRNTRKSVAEIAASVGFASVPHFATFIKHRTGKSPRDLRR